MITLVITDGNEQFVVNGKIDDIEWFLGNHADYLWSHGRIKTWALDSGLVAYQLPR